jgi:cobalt-precorrin-6B (C15)-methyltransferase
MIHPISIYIELDDSSNMEERLSGGPTQDEVMAISLQRLRLRSGDVLVDVGCGTGKVSLEAAKTCAKVYAIDARPEATRFALRNVGESTATNVEVLEGNATDILPRLGRMDAAFVGGSKDLDQVLELLAEKVRGHIVVNAVMVRTLHRAVEGMKRLGIFEEALHVQVSRSHDIVDNIMFRPIDPVYIIIGRVE